MIAAPPGSRTVSKKNLACGQLKNVQRYQKHVLLVRWFIFRVSYMFEATVGRANFFWSSCTCAFELNMNHINFFLYVCSNWFQRNNQWSKISDQKIFFQKLLNHFHPAFTVCFLISGNYLKELPENRQNGNFLLKNIFKFGAGKIKCQQQARVFQFILINWIFH